MTLNDRNFFEENFKTTKTFKHESSIRDSDVLVFSETMNGYFNIVVNEAWVRWNKEMHAHAEWYKNDDPIAFEWAKDGSPEYEADFYRSAKAWAAAKATSVPEGFCLVPKEIPDRVVSCLENSGFHWGDGTRDYYTPIYSLMVEVASLSGDAA
ncbi:hypothetical protein [Acinetobacter pittii]|uniref:hypothetical protein n=1 Tax=Acinetobacter pittii TaxID=48296 RepID=UPI00355B4DC8